MTSALEAVIGQVKAKKRLAYGACQAFGLAANTIAALSIVVVRNLHVTARRATAAAETGGSSNGSGPPQPPRPAAAGVSTKNSIAMAALVADPH